MKNRLANIIASPYIGALFGGLLVWLISQAVFYLVVIFPRREMEPMTAASLFCGDCLNWAMITLLLMIFGVAVGAFPGYRAGKK
jgi:hypothetical protein